VILIDLCEPTERFSKSTADGDNPRIRSLGDAKVNNHHTTDDRCNRPGGANRTTDHGFC